MFAFLKILIPLFLHFGKHKRGSSTIGLIGKTTFNAEF